MLCTRLRALIGVLGIRKGEFARQIGFSQAYVSMILSGSRPNPSDRFFESVARQYQVSVPWLRSGSGEMFAPPQGELGPADLELLQKYRMLPLSERRLVDDIVNAMVLKNELEKPADTKQTAQDAARFNGRLK